MKKLFIGILLVLLSLFALWWFFAPIDYYEYDAQSANECVSGELYDEEYRVCYFDFYCETEIECTEIDKQYGAVLEALADEYVATEPEHVIYGENTELVRATPVEIESTQENKLKAPATTEVLKTPPAVSSLVDIVPLKIAVTQPTIDELMTMLLPTIHRSRITTIIEESDGPENTLAYVEPVNTNGSAWKMAYDPVDTFSAGKKYKNINELLTTIIHEYAHVLTLHNTQVEHVAADAEYIECLYEEVIVDEGCAKTTSYITAFINEFWSEKERDAAFEALEDADEENFAYELFTNRPNDFVTEYAATNPIEDAAESFALFVLRPKPRSTTIAHEKIIIFYNYPELVTLRNYMRGGVAQILERTSI